MPLFHTDDQVMLLDTARDFLTEQAPVSQMRALRDAADPIGFAPELWRRFAEMGFTAILIPEADGGLGLGHVETGVILEEIGRNLSLSPFLQTAMGAVTALVSASQALRQQWLPQIASGAVVAALAIDESTKHHPDRIQLKAERSGNGFKLTGTKRFVPHGHVANLLIVAARSAGDMNERDGITLFAVSKDHAGVRAEPTRLADSSIAAKITFDDALVDGDAVVGECDRGRAILSSVLNALRIGASSEMIGAGARAMDMTVDYLKQRKQFGVPIGSFQALQHRTAHLYSEMEIARAAVLKAQQLLDERDERATQAVHVAKAMTGMATALAVQEAVQMHGGIGMTDEYDIGFYMKRQRVLAEMFGDTDFHADQLARLSGY